MPERKCDEKALLTHKCVQRGILRVKPKRSHPRLLHFVPGAIESVCERERESERARERESERARERARERKREREREGNAR